MCLHNPPLSAATRWQPNLRTGSFLNGSYEEKLKKSKKNVEMLQYYASKHVI